MPSTQLHIPTMQSIATAISTLATLVMRSAVGINGTRRQKDRQRAGPSKRLEMLCSLCSYCGDNPQLAQHAQCVVDFCLFDNLATDDSTDKYTLDAHCLGG